ncbi:MAG: hypothetical protein HQK54_04125 [Oligoflexales bacterium]|nr:hypothetical protein [Oligoflexales bacterium]
MVRRDTGFSSYVPLGDEISNLMDSFFEEKKRTAFQISNYVKKEGRGYRALKKSGFSSDEPEQQLLLDYGDPKNRSEKQPLTSHGLRTTKHFFVYNQNDHFCCNIKDLTRLNIFLHRTVYEALSMLLKGALEEELHSAYKKIRPTPTPRKKEDSISKASVKNIKRKNQPFIDPKKTLKDESKIRYPDLLGINDLRCFLNMVIREPALFDFDEEINDRLISVIYIEPQKSPEEIYGSIIDVIKEYDENSENRVLKWYCDNYTPGVERLLTSITCDQAETFYDRSSFILLVKEMYVLGLHTKPQSVNASELTSFAERTARQLKASRSRAVQDAKSNLIFNHQNLVRAIKKFEAIEYRHLIVSKYKGLEDIGYKTLELLKKIFLISTYEYGLHLHMFKKYDPSNIKKHMEDFYLKLQKDEKTKLDELIASFKFFNLERTELIQKRDRITCINKIKFLLYFIEHYEKEGSGIYGNLGKEEKERLSSIKLKMKEIRNDCLYSADTSSLKDIMDKIPSIASLDSMVSFLFNIIKILDRDCRESDHPWLIVHGENEREMLKFLDVANKWIEEELEATERWLNLLSKSVHSNWNIGEYFAFPQDETLKECNKTENSLSSPIIGKLVNPETGKEMLKNRLERLEYRGYENPLSRHSEEVRLEKALIEVANRADQLEAKFREDVKFIFKIDNAAAGNSEPI